MLRFAHTGEVLGLPGQFVAGLVSLGGVILVYTGFALSYRRFVAWCARRRRPADAGRRGRRLAASITVRPFASDRRRPSGVRTIMKTRTTSHRRSPAALPSTRRRWATVGVLAASAALAGRVSAASVQLPPEFRARNVEPLPAAWLRDERHAASDVTIAPAVMRTDEQLPAVTRFDIPPGPLSTVIKAFEAVTGYTVTLADPALGDIPSPGVSGVTTTDKAIAAILSGTGIIARETGLRQLTLAVGGVSESLDVTATTRVASPRYVRPVSETPQSIQVIPRQVMEAQGVTTLSEALRNVPGISLQAGEGGGASNTSGDMFNLRGFSANNSLFVDGVRDDGLVSRDVYNLEQVEVFLGPTGTDVGRGTAAGYVNMTTKTPAVQTRYSGAATFGTADQRRVSVDVNQATPFGDAGSWWRGTAVRLNGAGPGQRRPRPRRGAAADAGDRAVARARPRHARPRRRRRPVPAPGQPARLRHPRRGVAGWSARARRPRSPRTRSTSRTTTARPAHDYDEVSQDSGFAKVEYDIRPTVQLRSQLRYNQAHRTAVISTIQNPAAYNPATELVTIARQGNERENEITSSQTSVSTVARAGRTSHALIGTVEFTNESQFAPTLGGLGTRPPANIYAPDVNAPGDGDERGPDRRVQRRHGVDRRGVGVRHRGRRARACSSPAACASSATARRSWRVTRPASRRPTSTRTTRCSAARWARSTSSPTRATSTSRGATRRRRPAPRTSR